MMNTANYIEQLKQLITDHKCQYINILKHNPKYKKLLDFVENWSPLLKDEFYTLKTKVFWVLNDIHEFPKCHNKKCQKELRHKNVFRLNLDDIYHYCNAKCMNSDAEVKKHHVQNMQEKFGVDNVFQLKHIKDKIKNTNIMKYGVAHPSELKEFKEKALQTKLRKNNGKYESKETIEKRKRTIKEKYGCDYLLQNDQIKRKILETNLKKYGCVRYTQTKESIERTKKIKLEKYGSENYNNIEKIKKTSLERYGVENPGATYESISKSHRRLFYDNTNFSSTPELAYYIWLKDNKTDFEYQPKSKVIEYFDCKGEKHKYYPDFWLKKTDELHEIKGENHFQDFDPTKKMICINDRSRDYIAEAKQICMKQNNVKILSNNDYVIYLKYCQEKFKSSTWYRQFKNYE